MAAHFPTSPVAPASTPPGVTYVPFPLVAARTPSLGATYAPPPLGATYAPHLLEATYTPFPLGATYAPSRLGAAYVPSPGASAHTVHPTNAPYRFGNPTAAPRHTYQPPPPQFPPIPTGGHFPTSTQLPMAPSSARPPTPSWHSPRPPPPWATKQSWHSPPTAYSPSPPPPRTTTPGRGRNTIDLSDLSPSPPPRPVYQSHPFHRSIIDKTGLFSKETQRITDRFVMDIGGRDLSHRFKGVVNPETVTSLDMTNDPVIFAERFQAGFARLPS